MRIYNIDEEYFNCINSYEKAYWLGFLSADAHLFSAGGIVAGIQLELSEKDLSQLERFKYAISSDAPIKPANHGQYREYRLRVCSAAMVRSLMQYGLTQNKSVSLPFPDIDKQYYASYILGYFDGDGSITIECGKKPRVQFLGNYSFLDAVGDILHQIPGVNKATIHKGSGIFRILYGGRKQVQAIKNWMYKDGCISLDRKRLMFPLV